MSDAQNQSTPAWAEAVVIGITEALASLKADDPLSVQVWLGNAMAAARLEELRRGATNV